MESYVKDFQSFQAGKDERPVTLVCFSKKSIKIGNHRCSKCKKKKKKKKNLGEQIITLVQKMEN